MKSNSADTRAELVSVIIPAYNSEKTIGFAIESILNQTWKTLEIIIVNDGSTDETANVIKSFEKDSRITAIHQENAGCSNAKNIGLKASKGAFIQYLDADDVLSTDKIEVQLGVLRANRNAIAVCRTIRFENTPQNHPSMEVDSPFLYSSSDPLEFMLHLYGLNGKRGMIQPNAFLISRIIADKVGSWDETLSPAPDEDGEYFCRVILAASAIVFTPEPVNYYRTSKKNTLSKQTSYLHCKGALASILKIKNHLLALENSPRIKWLIARQLSAFQYQYYHLYPGLIRTADQALHTIGFKHNIPIEGGAKFRLLARLAGMKNALRIKKLLSRLR